MQVNQNSQMPQQPSVMQPYSQKQLSLNQLVSQLNTQQHQLNTQQHHQDSSDQTKHQQQQNQQNNQHNEIVEQQDNMGEQDKQDDKEIQAKQIRQEQKQFDDIGQTQPKQGLDNSNQQQHQTKSNAVQIIQQQSLQTLQNTQKIQNIDQTQDKKVTEEQEKKEERQQKEKSNEESEELKIEQKQYDIIEIENEQQQKCQQQNNQEGRELGYFQIYPKKHYPRTSFLKKQKPLNKFFSNPEPIPQQSNQTPQLSSNNQSDGKWLQYLKVVYNHYCKSTYATGKFPTFDRIKESTSCLNINTFVHFCRDFDIDINRIKLIQHFKKATHFQKDMNFDQFTFAIHCLSKQKMNKQTQSKKVNDERFQEFLKAIHLDNNAHFQNKMVLLGIKARKHGINAYQSLVKPKKQSPYKFNILSSNGRNPQDISQQLEMIKFQKQDNRIRLQKIRHERIKKQEHQFELSTKMPIRTKIIKTGGYMSPLRPIKMTIQTTPNSHQKLTSSNIGYPKTSLNGSYMLHESRYKQITTQRSVCEQKIQKSLFNVKDERSNISNSLNSGYLMNFRSKRDSQKQGKTQNLQLNKIVRDAKKQQYRQNSLQASFKEQNPQSDTKRYQTLQNEQKSVLPLHHQNGLKTESKYSTPNLLFVGNMGEYSGIKQKQHSFEAFLGDIEADEDEYLSKHFNLGLLNV